MPICKMLKSTIALFNYTPWNITVKYTKTLGSTKLERVFACKLCAVQIASRHERLWRMIIKVLALRQVCIMQQQKKQPQDNIYEK